LYLTTTHFHPEHGFGAQAFRGAATIIYNAAQRAELRRKGPGYIEMFTGMSPAYAAELRDVELTGPDITYDGRAEIDLGGHTAVLRSRGPAHTASDQSGFARASHGLMIIRDALSKPDQSRRICCRASVSRPDG